MSSSHEQHISGRNETEQHHHIIVSATPNRSGVSQQPLPSPPSYQEYSVPAVIPTVQQAHQRTFNQNAWLTSCKRTALVQSVCGFLCIALGFVSVGLECVYGDTGIAIWSGVWIVFSGFLGVSAIRHPGNTCVVTTYMIFSSFSIPCAILILSVYCAAAFEEDPQDQSTPYPARVSVDAMIAFVGLLALMSSVAGCVVAGKKTCRNTGNDVMIERRNYYVSHLSSSDIHLHTGASGPLHYQSDFHPLQVPVPDLPQYATEAPPPYEIPGANQTQQYKKSNEHTQQKTV